MNNAFVFENVDKHSTYVYILFVIYDVITTDFGYIRDSFNLAKNINEILLLLLLVSAKRRSGKYSNLYFVCDTRARILLLLLLLQCRIMLLRKNLIKR